MSANIIRTKSKVRVSHKDWRTVFDLMSAKVKHFSMPTKKQRDYFSNVLQSHFFINNSYNTDYQAIQKYYSSYKNNAIATKKKSDMIEYIKMTYFLCKSLIPPM